MTEDAEDDGVSQWQGQGIYLCAAGNENLFAPGAQVQGLVQALDGGASLEAAVFIAADDNGGAAGQGAADGFIGLAAHDQDMIHGGGLEPLQFLRDVPGDGVSSADDPVGSHGRDDNDFHDDCSLERPLREGKCLR